MGTYHSIMGANAHPDVTSVGGVDIQDRWVGYSSEGPSILGMDPNKSDVAAYTHFIGSNVFGSNLPDDGTSTACPVAARCIATLRTNVPQQHVPPTQLRSDIERYARRPSGSTGWDPQLGHGVINPVPVGRQHGVIP